MRMSLIILGILIILGFNPVLAEGAKTSLEVGVPSQDLTASMLKVIGGLLVVIFAIFASAWLYRRFVNMQSVNSKSLKVIGGLSINQKDRVVLLQVGDEQLLLGVSPGRIQTLHVLNHPIDVEEAIGDKRENFSVQLNSAIKNWKSS